MTYVLIEIPDTASGVNNLKPELKVTVRYGTTGAYKYVYGGTVKAKVVTSPPIIE